MVPGETWQQIEECVYYIFFEIQREKVIISIKEAFLKSNESSLNE